MPFMVDSTGASPLRYLIWGSRGWIAGHLKSLLEKFDFQVYTTDVRLEEREAAWAVLSEIKPTHVIIAAGCTGRPNVDWCEDNKEQTIRSNVLGTINVLDLCCMTKLHCTVLATGCLYQYDEEHFIGGPGFTELDQPNFRGSFYSMTKGVVELVAKSYENCLILRLRMPVSDDLHPRSFLTKITSYDRVVNIPNSHSMLHDLLPAIIVLSQNHEAGIYNFTNPGVISHNEVLAMFKSMIRPNFQWKNFSLSEQAQILKAERSNCCLDTTKLEQKLQEYGMDLPDIHTSYRQCFQRMKEAGFQ